MANENLQVLESLALEIPKEQPTFVKTKEVGDILERATNYLKVGAPIHFCGAAGTGKTTLALYLAGQLGRPVILIHGDEEFETSDLIGESSGYQRKYLLDEFVHSVRKFEDTMTKGWVDNRLTIAIKYGCTLIYDEFTRSRPEANNVLLSILEEKIMDLPAGRGGESHLQVHPGFSAIFTSNPEEYAGVHKTQDALRDRMVTINLDHYDRDTEIEIVMKRSELSKSDAQRIVDIVRTFRESGKFQFSPTVRAAILLGKVLKLKGAKISAQDEHFVKACFDVLDPLTYRLKNGNAEYKSKKSETKRYVLNLIQQFSGSGLKRIK